MSPNEESLLALDTITASTFHELKNLIGQLSLNLDELSAHGCPGAEENISGARFACRRISDRMVQVLTLYKLGKGLLTVNLDAHSPADFIEGIAVEARALAAGRLQVQVATDAAPPFWFFDRSLVEIAVMNALHNAFAYARSALRISAAGRDGWLVLTVEDDSGGFPAHILELPASVESATRGGTGLGLYFSRVVAESHLNGDRRGHLDLSNRQDPPGAVFSLALP